MASDEPESLGLRQARSGHTYIPLHEHIGGGQQSCEWLEGGPTTDPRRPDSPRTPTCTTSPTESTLFDHPLHITPERHTSSEPPFSHHHTDPDDTWSLPIHATPSPALSQCSAVAALSSCLPLLTVRHASTGAVVFAENATRPGSAHGCVTIPCGLNFTPSGWHTAALC